MSDKIKFETKGLYVCDARKNKKCAKISYYKNGGECFLTSNKEYEKKRNIFSRLFKRMLKEGSI